MINKFLSNENYWVENDKKNLPSYVIFRLKKCTEIFGYKLSARNRREGRNYLLVSFYTRGTYISLLVALQLQRPKCIGWVPLLKKTFMMACPTYYGAISFSAR